jgi:hypothetical protein
MNQFSALSHFLPRQFLTITRESILSCPALSTMFPGRLARLATGADSTKLLTISLRRLVLRFDYATEVMRVERD